MLHEGQQQLVHLALADLFGKKAERIGHHRWVVLLTITGDDGVAGLINQAHGVQCAGVDHTLRMVARVAHLVHAVGQLARRRDAGEHHVAIKREERLGKPVAIAYRPRDVKFHHKECFPGEARITMMPDAPRFGIPAIQ